jgi:hypothetical protein
LAFIKAELFNDINALLDTDEKTQELASLDTSVSNWRGYFIAIGVLSLIACIGYLVLSLNSFWVSRRLEYYHMSN